MKKKNVLIGIALLFTTSILNGAAQSTLTLNGTYPDVFSVAFVSATAELGNLQDIQENSNKDIGNFVVNSNGDTGFSITFTTDKLAQGVADDGVLVKFDGTNYIAANTITAENKLPYTLKIQSVNEGTLGAALPWQGANQAITYGTAINFDNAVTARTVNKQFKLLLGAPGNTTALQSGAYRSVVTVTIANL
jgi:hypothetical protein